jgi:hypothetical protein
MLLLILGMLGGEWGIKNVNWRFEGYEGGKRWISLGALRRKGLWVKIILGDIRGEIG